MRRKGRWFCYLLSIGLLTLPIRVQAGSQPAELRGFTPREWKSKGQMKGEVHSLRVKLRELRLQETRRPRDIQAAPTQDMSYPGKAVPSYNAALMHRERNESWLSGPSYSGDSSYSSDGFRPLTPGELGDPETDTIHDEEPNVEWWEMNERSRSQRGGWFRSRFGARQPNQMQQKQQGGNNAGPPGGFDGGGGGQGIVPGQNMPQGGGINSGGMR